MRHCLLTIVLLASASIASAATVVVNASDDLYNAGTSGFDGTMAEAVNVTGLSSITFTVVPGRTVTLNNGTYNDADGAGSVGDSYNSGGNGIAGLTAPVDGFLAGAFVGATPTATPAQLNFTTSGTSFATLAPALQQAFFIGDGRTGDASGATQTFYVPTGATTLYLGISDACGYHGSPSCYGDNNGSFTVTTMGTTAGAVPEPAAWAMMLVGFGVVGTGVRHRRQAVVAA
jgi:hypothetical protein